MRLRLLLVGLGAGWAAAQSSNCSISSGYLAPIVGNTSATVPCALQQALYNLTSLPALSPATVSLAVVDEQSGEVLVDLNGDKLLTTGSLLKARPSTRRIALMAAGRADVKRAEDFRP